MFIVCIVVLAADDKGMNLQKKQNSKKDVFAWQVRFIRPELAKRDLCLIKFN